MFRIIENVLWIHSRISVHCGKTQLWNRSGTTPRGCELTRAARVLNPQAVGWRGDRHLPVEQVTEHQTLLERIPLVCDVQFGSSGSVALPPNSQQRMIMAF